MSKHKNATEPEEHSIIDRVKSRLSIFEIKSCSLGYYVNVISERIAVTPRLYMKRLSDARNLVSANIREESL